nr:MULTISPECIES: fimbria/pilus periplasmic chaperone [unclassified Dyella]
MHNNGQSPVVVQSWLDTGDPRQSPEAIRTPFVLMPPIARLDDGHSQILRLVYTGEPLASDKESVFWLNVLEIPPKSGSAGDANVLQFAIRTRIKVFFRPEHLPGSPEDAMRQLSWKMVSSGSGYAMEIGNPSPYHVSLAGIELLADGMSLMVGDGMARPGETLTLAIPKLQRQPAKAFVHYVAIDDYGAHREFDKGL